MGNTDGTALGDGERPRLNGGSNLQLVVSPNDGLNQLLPVAAATEQEHQAERPNEVGTQEHQAIGTGGRAIAVDHLCSLSPQEITQPTIDGQCTVGKVASGDMGDRTVGVDGAPHVALHLPGEVEDNDRQGVVHPEQAQEHVVPSRHLASTATAGAVTGEAETEVRLVGNQAAAAGIEHTLQQDQHRHVNREGVNVVDHEVGRSQGDRTCSHLAAHGNNRAVEGLTDSSKSVRNCGTSSASMHALNPLRKNWLQRNSRVTEHVLGTAQGTHGVVVDIEAKAVEAEPDAHPVEVADQGIASLEYPVKNVVHVLGGVIVTNHGDGSVSASTNNQKSADPGVMGEQRELCGVIDADVRIRRHRVHVLSNDDAHRAADCEVDR